MPQFTVGVPAFEEPRAFVRTSGLWDARAWQANLRSGNKIPARHNVVYDTQWLSFGIGSAPSRRRKLPADIPPMPQMVYDGWWTVDQLRRLAGLERRAGSFPSKRHAPLLKLPHAQAWQANAKSGDRPANIPINPNLYYAEWDGWLDWLGKTAKTTPPSSPRIPGLRDYLKTRERAKLLALSHLSRVWPFPRSSRIPHTGRTPAIEAPSPPAASV
jgi:hypothetical protein